MTLEKHEDWTWIAKDPAAFARIKNSASITARLDIPQTAELVGWGRTNPELLAKAKEFIMPQILAKLSTRPPAEQKAFSAYADIVWSYLEQLHSVGGSLDLNDQGVVLSYSGQFLPDSATGTLLRYGPGPSPAIARSVPSDSLLSIVARQNMPAQVEFVNPLLDTLITVDYPAVAGPLKLAKTSFNSYARQSDGGAVLTMNIIAPKTKGAPPVIDLMGVQTGKFTEAEVTSFYKNTVALSDQVTNSMLAASSALTPNAPAVKVTQQLTENALTIDGHKFGAIVSTAETQVGGKPQTTTTTQYFGVVNKLLVYSTNEAALRAKLPALDSGTPVANPVVVSFQDHEIMTMAVHGERIVDMVTADLPLDLTDGDVKAQIASLKQGYADAAPMTAGVTATQAQATMTINIPYKFIAQSVRLAQFASASKKPAAPVTTMPSASQTTPPSAAKPSAPAKPVAPAKPASPGTL